MWLTLTFFIYIASFQYDYTESYLSWSSFPEEEMKC